MMALVQTFGGTDVHGCGDCPHAEGIVDCAQEPGGANAAHSASIRSMTMRGADRGRSRARWAISGLRRFGVLLALCRTGISLSAQEPGPAAARTTIVILSDGPMADSAWALLFSELRREAATDARDIPVLDTDPKLVRGM